MKRILCAFMALMLCLILCACVDEKGTLIEKSDDYYINDVAAALSYETRAVVYYNSLALYEATKAQIVVATVKNIGNERVSDYGYRLFNEWEVGDKKLDNGFLFVFQIAGTPEDGDYTLQLGKGTSSIITDSEADDLLWTYAEPGFARGDYDTAVLTAYRVLFECVRDYYNVNLSYRDANALIRTGKIVSEENYATSAEQAGGFAGGRSEAPEPSKGGISVGWIIFFVIIIIIIVAIVRRRRNPGTGSTVGASGTTRVMPVFVSTPRVRSTPPPVRRTGVTPPPAARSYVNKSAPNTSRVYRNAQPSAGVFGSILGSASASRSSASRPAASRSSTSSSVSRSSTSSSRSSVSRPSSFGGGRSGGGSSIGGGASRRK